MGGDFLFDDQNSQKNFTRLSSLVGQGRVTGIVGAGLSIDGGMPSWSQFHARLREEAARELAGKPAAEPTHFDPNTASDDLGRFRQVIGSDRYMNLMHELFDNITTVMPEGYTLSASVFRRLATTNYDNFLEALAYQQEYNPALQIYPVDILDPRYIYLHGHARSAKAHRDLVVCKDDYILAYDKLIGVALNWLRELLLQGPCVFLGSSFADPEFLGILKYIYSARFVYQQIGGRFEEIIAASPDWFAILGVDVDRLTDPYEEMGVRHEIGAITHNLWQLGLSVIWYQKDRQSGHTNLIQLLRELRDQLPPDSRQPEEPVFLLHANDLEQLGSLTNPNQEQINRVIGLLHTSPEYRRHFYFHATSLAWVEILFSAGLLPGVEEPVSDEIGNARIIQWDAAPYVERVAEANQELAIRFIENIHTDNWHVLFVLSRIARRLQTSQLEPLVSFIVEWVECKYFRIGLVEDNCLGILRVLVDGERFATAAVLLEALLKPRETGIGGIETKASMDESDRLLELSRRLAQGVPQEMLDFYLNSLRMALNADENRGKAQWSDWRRAIEVSDSHRWAKSALDLYVDGLRDATIAVANRMPDEATRYIGSFLESSYQIVKRIGIFVAAVQPGLISSVEGQLFVGDSLFSVELFHEQMLLLQKHFGVLGKVKRDDVIMQLRQGPSHKVDDASPDATRYRDDWRQRVLSILPSELIPESDRSWLSSRPPIIEETDDPLFYSFSGGYWPESPATPQQLGEVLVQGVDRLIQVLRDPNSRFPKRRFTSSNLIWKALHDLILEDPTKLLPLAQLLEPEDFERSEASYFLLAYTEAAQKGMTFSWDPLLDMAERLLSSTHTTSRGEPGWAWAVARLFDGSLLSPHRIPVSLFGRVVQVMQGLVTAFHTPLDQYPSDDGQGLRYHQVNSPAGMAASGLLTILWRCLDELSQDEGPTTAIV